jgi:TonB-dependent receptor
MNTNQIPLGRGLLVAFGFGIAAVRCWAGDIVGVVSDSSNKEFLPGASVLLVEGGRTEFADSGGRFRFSGLAAGNYTLRFMYVGHETKTEAVRVPASGEVVVSIAMRQEVIELEAVVVEGYRAGRARAFQQKRNAINIADIVSSDAIGNLPDRNVSEAAGRLPGVSLVLDFDGGEGRYVSIRGVEPNLNQVTLDGATLAAPGGVRLGRAVPLDTLHASQISQIEVIKSATPDMDANALGGTLNIKTASPFDHKERFLAGSVGFNHSGTTEKSGLASDVTFSDIFGPKRHWGLSLGASYDKRFYANHRLQSAWDLRTIGGTEMWLPNRLELNSDTGIFERYGGNFGLEYRPEADARFYLRLNQSRQYHPFDQFETNVNVDNSPARVTLASPTSGTFAAAGVRTERRELNDRVDQHLLAITGGFSKVVGEFTIEPMATFSTAQEKTVLARRRDFRSNTGTTGAVTFDIGAFDFRRWAVDPAVDTPDKYPLRRTGDNYGTTDEDTLTAKIDVRRKADALFGRPGNLKAGFKYLQRDRVVDLTAVRLLPGATWNQTLAQLGTRAPIPVYRGRYTTGFRVNGQAATDYIKANPSATTFDAVTSAANSIEDDFDLDEYIYAAYAMGRVEIDKLTLLGGVRWEKTDATIRAVEARTVSGTLAGEFPTSGTRSYHEIFPNLQAAYRISDRFVLRAAITRTLGRPAYEDARPLSRFNYTPLGAAALNSAFPNTGTLNIGNPNLGPFLGSNYDLTLEWYGKGSGIVSAALFRKDVRDPIYSFVETRQNVVHSGVALERLDVSGVRNADSGRISGVEINLYQPFSFLPSPFDGLGIDANVTRITSTVKVPVRPGEDFPFFLQPGKIANVTLFYERARVSVRIAWSYVDEQLISLGSNATLDFYRHPRDQYDAQLSYRITPHYSVVASARNLGREPEQVSYGWTNRLRTSRDLGRDFRISLKFNY